MFNLNNKNMKALITGASGFVGSHLADALIIRGYEVFCMVRKTSSLRWLNGKKINFFFIDENSPKFQNIIDDSVSEMDYVFHVAGVVKSKNKEGFYRGNVDFTKNLLEALSRKNTKIKKFIHISSLAVCGPTPTETPLTEDYIPQPITTYGKSKLKAENEVLNYKEILPVVILRPPAIYGPRDSEILVYFQTFSKGLNAIIGFGKKYLSLIYVEDFINGIILSAEQETKSGDIFFLSSDEPYSWDQIGSVTADILKKNAIKIRIPHWFVYTTGMLTEFFYRFTDKTATLNIEKCKDITRKRWVCSNSKAKEILGFRAEYSLYEGFSKTIKWYKDYKWLK